MGPKVNHSGVSVVMPAYNAAGCLARAVSSVLNQSIPAQEVFVINDGSTDETRSVAQSFGDQITYLEQANRGQGAARNTGLRVAQGKFVAFLDSDDYWLPGFLEACVTFLRKHPEAIAVSTGLQFEQMGKPLLVLPKISASVEGLAKLPWVLDDFFTFWAEHDHVRTGSNVIRREVIQKAGYQQAHLRVSQDLEYWAYLGTFGKWGFIPEVLWVGSSEWVAARGGWLQKYRQRRKLCPTVEQWQERIVPRIKPEEWPSFKKVRGRVALGFAQNHVLAGRGDVAADIVRRYGSEMPPCWSASLMRSGLRAGKLGWWIACSVIQGREYQKAALMIVKGWRGERRASEVSGRRTG